MKSDFIHLRRTAGGIEVVGRHELRLGHRLPDGDGIHTEWYWDGHMLRVQTCRYGLYPLYIFQSNDEICLSTSLVSVLKRTGARSLDDAAIAVFLRLGFYLEGDTPFSDVRVLPAGTLEWSAEGCVITAHPRSTPAPSRLTRAEAIEHYAALFRTAVLKRDAGGDFVLPLTGGRDSRHILLELCRAGRKPRFCLTAELPPPATNEDLRVAQQLCATYGVPHQAVRQPRRFLHSMLHKNLLTDFCTDEHTWAMPVVNALDRQGSRVYDGIGGDVLSAGLFSSTERLRHFRAGRFEELAGDLLGDELAVSKILRPEAQQRFNRGSALARVREVLATHAEHPSPVASFLFWNRTRREVALYTFGMFSHETTVFAPYLDHAVFDFLVSLPGEMLLDKQFHTDTISYAFPSASGIGYARLRRDVAAERWQAAWRRRLHFIVLALDLATYFTLAKRAGRGGTGGASIINRRFVVPRLARLALDGDDRRVSFNLERVLCWTQLERWVAEHSGTPV
jgi:asparagine synthase (glutamine-hydrolysing)